MEILELIKNHPNLAYNKFIDTNQKDEVFTVLRYDQLRDVKNYTLKKGNEATSKALTLMWVKGLIK